MLVSWVQRFLLAFLVALPGVMLAGSAVAADVEVELRGFVTNVQDSPFAGGNDTEGIEVGERLRVELVYDDSTAQVSGDLTSFELTSLLITVPDTTQSGSFELVPADLNSATRLVFNANDEFHGLALPTNITGFEDLDAFSLSGVEFESEGFAGGEFKFNVGTPVVEGVFAPVGVPALGPLGLAALAGALLLLVQTRVRPIQSPSPGA